jgi:4-hydroxybenzoate polyprenyltransferase
MVHAGTIIRQVLSDRTIPVKLISLLSVVRWYNVLLIASAQYLGSLFIIFSPAEWRTVILDPRMFLLAVSSAFLIAAGFIINGFYDSERDLINRPNKAMFNQLVSKPFRLYCYFAFNIIGLLLSLLVSWPVAIFHAMFSAGLWLYSHKLNKKLFLGNIAGTSLSIAPFFSICLYWETITPFIALYVGFIFLIELTRGIVKDMIAFKGDIIMGYHTMPVEFGLPKTKNIVLLLQILTIGIPFALYSIKGVSIIMLYFLFSALLVGISLLLLLGADKVSTFKWINNLYKFILLTGILSTILF